MKRLIIFSSIFLFVRLAWSATYYADPAGSGTTCSNASPCTVATGIGKLVAGDTLYLKDGTYTGDSGMIYTDHLIGTSGSRITIAAVNEGSVAINGEAARMPIWLFHSQYITVQGINAYNAGMNGYTHSVITLNGDGSAPGGNSDGYNEVKRCIAWDTKTPDTVVGAIIVGISYENHDLVEDCAGWGRGRVVFYNYNGNYSTFRRNWGRYMGYATESVSPNGTMFLDYTGNINTLWENNIAEYDYVSGYDQNSYGSFFTEGIPTNMKLYGNIGIIKNGDQWRGTQMMMLMPCNSGSCGGTTVSITAKDNIMFVQPTNTFWIQPYYVYNKDTATVALDHNTSINGVGGGVSYFRSHVNVTNTNFLEQTTATGYDLYTNTGSGATIRYKYVDGTLGTDPLFPWAMNARIKAALNTSGYDTNYDLDTELQALFGTYPTAAPPANPTVTTTTATSVTVNTASSGGNVLDQGGSAVSARGVCWSYANPPTTADTCTTDGTGTGVFTSSLTSFLPHQTVFYIAYATNGSGTGYGSVLSFNTQQFQKWRSLTYDHTKVPSNQTNVPLFISFTNNDFRVAGSGGYVRNANGYDINHRTTSALTTVVPWQKMTWTDTTGALSHWLLAPSLSSSTDSTTYIAFDNSGITTQQNTASAVWTGLLGVWHMEDSASPTTDSIASGHSCAQSNGVTFAQTGKIGSAVVFDGSDDLLDCGATDIVGTGAVTFCAWIYPLLQPVDSNFYRIIDNGKYVIGLRTNVDNTGTLYITSDSASFAYSADNITQNQWNFICASRNASGTANIYVNGALNGTADQASGTPTAKSTNTFIGNRNAGDRSFKGTIDEVMIFGAVKSSDFIQILYNNQNAPASFFTLGGGLPLTTAFPVINYIW